MPTNLNYLDDFIDTIESSKDFNVLIISESKISDQPYLLTLNYQHQIIEVSVYINDSFEAFKQRAREALIKIYQTKLNAAKKEVEYLEDKIAGLIVTFDTQDKVSDLDDIEELKEIA